MSTAAAAGSSTFQVKPGYTGQLSALGWGLAAPTVYAGKRISTTTGNPDPSGADPGTQLYPITVPTGSQLISARLANVDGGNPTTDLDLYLYRDADGDGNFSNATLVGVSGSSGSAEDITLALPAAGKYAVAVVGFNTVAGGSVYDLNTWVVNDASPDDPSNPPGLTVTGDGPVTTGVPVNLTANWSAAAAKGLYLGVITYHATNAPTTANIAALSVFELTKTADTAATTETPDSGGTATTTPIGAPDPSVTLPADPTAAPVVTPVTMAQGGVLPVTASKPAALTVSAASVSGRTLTLKLQPGASGAVRASVMKGKKVVARAAERKVSAIDGSRELDVEPQTRPRDVHREGDRGARRSVEGQPRGAESHALERFCGAAPVWCRPVRFWAKGLWTDGRWDG